MNIPSIQVVGIAGGSGTRLWPLSRKARPKQFLSLPGRDSSLLQATYQRVAELADAENWWLICNALHVEGAKRTLPSLPANQILAEPTGRNTAPAIFWAALELEAKGCRDDVMVVLPADQDVQDTVAWQDALKRAVLAADDGVLVTLGIQPSRPDTGYGYIQMEDGDAGVFNVSAFHEKPSLELAESYLKAGNFVWNAGVFVARVSTFLDEGERLKPELLQGLRAFREARVKEESAASLFESLESISIDYALAEHAREVKVVPVECGWSDVGSFGTFASYLQSSAEGSNRLGRSDILVESQNVTILGDDSIRVAGLGVDNLLIVKTDDVLLIVDQAKAHESKRLLALMEENA